MTVANKSDIFSFEILDYWAFVYLIADLFKALETSEGSKTVAQNLGILNYGVSMPTLEEVFLKLGKQWPHQFV